MKSCLKFCRYDNGRYTMKAAIIHPLAVLFCLIPSLNLNGQTVMPEPNWDRSLALETIHKTDAQATLKPLFQMARAGSNRELLDALSSIIQDPGMPAPVKDFTIFSFTLGLSDLDANTVNPQVLDFLSTYEARTLVARDDHPRMAVPLFNIQAAAAGVQNRWDRQQAAARATSLLQEHPDQWIPSYLAAGPAGRRGFVDALDFASPEQLRGLGWSALALLDEKPELTLVTARAGMDSGDFELLRQSISRGDGPGLSRVLEAASRKLSAEERIALLDYSLQLGSDTKAALAIAQLAPALLDQAAVRKLLFSTLADRNLGAAAALVLGASPDREIQAHLSEIAAKKEGLAPQRAALAISTGRADREAER
jgi:hypothetical protein